MIRTVYGLPLLRLKSDFVSENGSYPVDTVTNIVLLNHALMPVGRLMQIFSSAANDNEGKSCIEV